MLPLPKFACELEISSQQNQAIQIMLVPTNSESWNHAAKWDTEKGGISPFHLRRAQGKDARKFDPTAVNEECTALSAQWYINVVFYLI